MAQLDTAAEGAIYTNCLLVCLGTDRVFRVALVLGEYGINH